MYGNYDKTPSIDHRYHLDSSPPFTLAYLSLLLVISHVLATPDYPNIYLHI